jgi:WhiB family redox-sensing transcriptional regulator
MSAMDRHPGLAWPAAPALADAACRAPDVDPSWFFPGRGEPVGRAKAVCARCPDLDACRGWALEVGSSLLHGIWGGTSDRERTRFRRARALELRSAAVYDEPMTDLAVDLAEPAANGHGAPNPEMHASAETEEPHLCQGCGKPLAGRSTQRWCGPACRSKTRRGSVRQVPVRPQEARKPVAVDGDTGFRAPSPGGSAFDQLVAVASGVPPGWQLTATVDVVTLCRSR